MAITNDRELGSIDPNTGLFIPADLRSRDIASSSQTAVPSTTTSTPPSTAGTGATNLSNALGSIIQTGSAAPKMATLVNRTTGNRKAVAVGSQDAQALFGQGYVLETAAPTAGTGAGTVAGAGGTTTATGSLTGTTTTTAPSTGTGLDVSGLRGRADKLRAEMFSSVYGYRPSEWTNLDPSTQRRLMNQRVTGLAGELGNIVEAIKVAKEEEAATKDTVMEQFNFALKAGVVDQLDAGILQQVSEQTGLGVDALKTLGQSEEIPELRSGANGSLWAIKWNSETGQFETQQVLAGKASGGGGGGTSDFDKEAAGLRDQLISGNVDWGTAWDSLKLRYPEKTNDQIDQALGGQVAYNQETGEFGEATGLAKGGLTGGKTTYTSPSGATYSF